MTTRLRGRSGGPVRSVALYGFLGSGNFGNDASLEAVLAWLRARRPDVDVRCITIAPEAVEARYGLPATSLVAWRAAAGTPRWKRRVGTALARLVEIPRSWRLAGVADAVVVPGMGVLEGLGTPPWGLPLWMFGMAVACRLRRRPFVLLDVGADPVRNRLTQRLFTATVNLAAHVSYRDDFSAQSMREAGAREPEAVAADIVFNRRDDAVVQPTGGLLVVGVMAYYGYDDDPVAGAAVRARYVGDLATVLRERVLAGDRLVLLGGDEVDLDVAQEVAALVRGGADGAADVPADRVVVQEFRTFDEVVAAMAEAEVVVASRYHNLIAALRLARPVIALGYAEKCDRLMAQVGLAEFARQIDDLDPAWLADRLAAARAEAPALTARIAGATAGYADQVETLLEGLAVRTFGWDDGAEGPTGADGSASVDQDPALAHPAQGGRGRRRAATRTQARG